MIFPLNKFNITASCFGNHDFVIFDYYLRKLLTHYIKDFELDHIIKLKNETNFPWIMSNVFYVPTKKPLGEGIEYIIIEKNNMKV